MVLSIGHSIYRNFQTLGGLGRAWQWSGTITGPTYGHTLYIATPSAAGDGVTLGGGLLNDAGESGGLLNEGGEGGGQA